MMRSFALADSVETVAAVGRWGQGRRGGWGGQGGNWRGREHIVEEVGRDAGVESGLTFGA